MRIVALLGMFYIGAASGYAQMPDSERLPPPRQAAPESEPLSEPRRVVPLTLGEVLESLEQHYPLLQAAYFDRGIAEGNLLAAQAPFDTYFDGMNSNQPGSTFPSYRSDVGVRRLSPKNGAIWTAGYRYGWGRFPSYEPYKTADGGEFRAGLNLPLLRNRAIDQGRADLAQARNDPDSVEPSIVRRRLLFARDAASIYWLWVAEGYRLQLANDLLRVARERDEQLTSRLEAGTASKFSRDDNRQNVYERAALVAAAERSFRQVSIQLSLFLRGGDGAPVVVGVERLSQFPKPAKPESNQLDAALQLALERRPELRELMLLRERVGVDLAQAENLLLPGVDLVLSGAQDMGATTLGKSISATDRTKIDLGFELHMPYEFSEARGRALKARSRLSQIDTELRFERDQIATEVRNAWTSLEQSYEVYRQAYQRVSLANEIATGERRRFDGGTSTVFNVNLREQFAFEAQLAAITALFDYYHALADFRASIGLGQLREKP